MSKLTKLIRSPRLFFKDMVTKRFLNEKPAPKKPAPKTLIIENINKFMPFTHVLHTGEGENGIVHLDLWMEYFLKANIKFLVVTRHMVTFERIKEKYPYVSLAYAKEKKDIDNLFEIFSTIKACFYPSNTGNNLHLFQQNKDIKHIFIGHGDSDKTASAHKYFRVYDENWVASQAHIDRFKNAGFRYNGLNMIKVGRPNLKETLLNCQEDWNNRFGENLKILYLSTWEGVYKEQDYTSVYVIEGLLRGISNLTEDNNTSIDIKLHPFIGRRDKSLLEKEKSIKNIANELEINIQSHSKEVPVSELIKKSNLFICDISAVVSECLAGNGPIFVYIPKDKEIKLSQSDMSYEDYTYTFSSVEELLEKMKEVLHGNDYLKEQREEAMEYILGKSKTLNDEFVKQLHTIEALESIYG